jgi:hypothetical protein
MLAVRRHPLTGKEVWQDMTALWNADSISVEELSPGRALSDDVPENEQLPAEAHAKSLSLSPESTSASEETPVAAAAGLALSSSSTSEAKSV